MLNRVRTMAAGDDPLSSERFTAFWVEGASEEQRDAHNRAQRWSHVLLWQIDRLYEARARALVSNKRVRPAGRLRRQQQPDAPVEFRRPPEEQLRQGREAAAR